MQKIKSRCVKINIQRNRIERRQCQWQWHQNNLLDGAVEQQCRRTEQNDAVDVGDGCSKKKKMQRLLDGAVVVQRPLNGASRTNAVAEQRWWLVEEE